MRKVVYAWIKPDARRGYYEVAWDVLECAAETEDI